MVKGLKMVDDAEEVALYRFLRRQLAKTPEDRKLFELWWVNKAKQQIDGTEQESKK